MSAASLERAAAGLGPSGFLLLFAAAGALGLPCLPLSLAAGAAFGAWPGAGLSAAGAAVGSSANFLLARYLAGLLPARALPEAWKDLAPALRENGAWLVVLVRLSPFCPFGPATALFAASGLAFASFAAASTLAFLPAALVYAHAGALGRAALTGAGGLSYGALSLAATAALLFWAAHRLLRRTLRGR